MAWPHLEGMFGVFALVVAGIFLVSLGIYSLSVADFSTIQLPAVNWGLIGFVTIGGGIASFGSALAVIKLG